MAKKKKNKYTVNILWKDRRRRLGMPLSFQRYRLGEDRLFYEKGFLSTSVDDILLYRVRDISVKISFWQRLTGVGTVTVNSSEARRSTRILRINCGNCRTRRSSILWKIKRRIKKRENNGLTSGGQDGTINIVYESFINNLTGKML